MFRVDAAFFAQFKAFFERIQEREVNKTTGKLFKSLFSIISVAATISKFKQENIKNLIQLLNP